MIAEVLVIVNEQKTRKSLILFSCKKGQIIHMKGEDVISVKSIGQSAEEGKYKLTFRYKSP